MTPFTRRERNVVIITTIVVAITRVWALSRSMWEWDEALFSHGVRDFDVVQHHPHPPGYPLFIAAAKLLRFVVHSDFRAVQAVALLGAIALFPLTFLLARELRFSFLTAYCGALIFVFAPNVWYYGGTGFSDVPGVALLLGASVLLLRSCGSADETSRRTASQAVPYLLGALMLGLAIGFRPQMILAGAAPALLATWHQPLRRVVAAIAIGAAVIIICYGGAALASESPKSYVETVRAQQQYLHDVDSYHNVYRAPLVPTLLRPFFYESMRAGRDAARYVAIFAAIAFLASLIRPHPGVWLLILIFAPLNIFSWLMLDMYAASRYAVSYVAMYALLAAFGIEIVCRLPWAVRRSLSPANGLRLAANAVLALTLAAHLAYRAYPAIRDVRRASAPNAAAMEWIRRNLDPRKTRIYCFEGLGPFASYYLERDYDVVYVASPDAIPETTPQQRQPWYVTDAIAKRRDALNFVRPRAGRLYDVARQRYFEASVMRVIPTAHFSGGWYDQESDGTNTWRWLSSRGAITFPPTHGKAKLALKFRVPIDSLPTPPTIEITLNGALLERIVATKADYALTWTVPARADAPNVVELSTSATANPKKLGTADDSRDLGLLLGDFSWSAVP
ncbi:MAG TPA: DUF2723 domain-containing protein [Thermoanaerobaculia bacterium]|nr:DUF2723 domain-containing protein [Thermoanaerobaculia bacterium]